MTSGAVTQPHRSPIRCIQHYQHRWPVAMLGIGEVHTNLDRLSERRDG